jgi:hypothetical protein
VKAPPSEPSSALRAPGRSSGAPATGEFTPSRDILNYDQIVATKLGHELLHLRVPSHDKLYCLVLSRYIPDWRERE